MRGPQEGCEKVCEEECEERCEEGALWRCAFAEDYHCNIAAGQMRQRKDTCFKCVVQKGIRKAKHGRFHLNISSRSP